MPTSVVIETKSIKAQPSISNYNYNNNNDKHIL